MENRQQQYDSADNEQAVLAPNTVEVSINSTGNALEMLSWWPGPAAESCGLQVLKRVVEQKKQSQNGVAEVHVSCKHQA